MFADCVDTCGNRRRWHEIHLIYLLLLPYFLASMGTKKFAKHGNKAVSSKCGSGDVLEALKIKIDLEPK